MTYEILTDSCSGRMAAVTAHTPTLRGLATPSAGATAATSSVARAGTLAMDGEFGEHILVDAWLTELQHHQLWWLVQPQRKRLPCHLRLDAQPVGRVLRG